jgi:hypothetical protein
MTHLNNLLKNKLILQKNYHLQEQSIDNWPFWMFEENIKIVNELTDEEEKQKKKQDDDQQKNTPNFNPSSYMNSMNSMSSKFK